MGFLKSLFSSATALFSSAPGLFKSAITTAATVKRAAEDIAINYAVRFRRSEIGKALEGIIKKGGKVLARGTDAAVKAVSEAYRAAKDVFEEEREFREKQRRDGRLSEADEERLRELHAEREQLKQEINNLKAGVAAVKLQTESVISTLLSADELSANTGIIASKACPDCGGIMRIRQGGRNIRTNEYRFFAHSCYKEAGSHAKSC